MDRGLCGGAVRRVLVLVLLFVALSQSACSFPARWRRLGAIDLSIVQSARLALQRDGVLRERERLPLSAEEEDFDLERSRGGGVGSMIVGELIAIFPGLIVPGLGHRYAGDHETGRRLWRIGEFGYVLTALGGGLALGGYALDQNDLQGTAYSLYGTGGVIGGVGVFYLLSAWFYDMIDTPRAVRTGGEPPPRSKFVESLELFE